MSSADDDNLRSRTRIWFARLGRVQKVLAASAALVITTGAVASAITSIVGLGGTVLPDGPKPSPGGVTEAPRPLPEGVLVTDVVPGSPADRAGLKVGDVVTDVGGKPVEDADDFRRALKAFGSGEVVLLSVSRDSRTESVRARLGRIPGTDSELGVTSRDTRPETIAAEPEPSETTGETPAPEDPGEDTAGEADGHISPDHTGDASATSSAGSTGTPAAPEMETSTVSGE
jgi:membrane-associated protease RseP (regulator of RpoE activity)